MVVGYKINKNTKTGLPSLLIVIQLNWPCCWYCFAYLLLTLFASQCDRLLVFGRCTHFITLHLAAAAPKIEKTNIANVVWLCGEKY